MIACEQAHWCVGLGKFLWQSWGGKWGSTAKIFPNCTSEPLELTQARFQWMTSPCIGFCPQIYCYNPGQNYWDISMQFSISPHATISLKLNEVAPLPAPCAMLFWPNSSRVHFLCYRKQHCNREGENSLLIYDGNNFGRTSEWENFVKDQSISVPL